MLVLALLSISALTIVIIGTVRNLEFITETTLTLLLPITALMLFASTAAIFIFLTFRNTASAEIFFFYIFIFTFSFDIFKFIIPMSAGAELPFSYGMMATRLVYFGRFMGALALFCSGLFSSGMEYQRMGFVLSVSIIISAALVWMLPVDISSSVPGNTWEIGRFLEIAIAIGLLKLIAVLNFIIAGLKNENYEYLLIAAGLFLAAAGRELLFYMPGYIPAAAGFILLVTGTIIFGIRTHQLYLWE